MKNSMQVRIFGLEMHSYVDGPGERIVIFFQGCNRHCEGCHNPDSWDRDGGLLDETDSLESLIKEIKRRNPLLMGITFSGGEPFLQPEALLELAKYAHNDLKLDVWCYTGYKFEEIYSRFREILDYIDTLVDGEFIKAERSLDLTFKGSRNQRIIDVPASLESEGVVIKDEEV